MNNQKGQGLSSEIQTVGKAPSQTKETAIGSNGDIAKFEVPYGRSDQ
jgi:hypothetical protein